MIDMGLIGVGRRAVAPPPPPPPRRPRNKRAMSEADRRARRRSRKLTDEQVRALRSTSIGKGELTTLARRFGVSLAVASKCRNGLSYRDIT